MTSHETFCYVAAEEVGCSAHFANTHIQDGVPTNGVKVNADGTARFTNDRTGHGMFVSVDRVEVF